MSRVTCYLGPRQVPRRAVVPQLQQLQPVAVVGRAERVVAPLEDFLSQDTTITVSSASRAVKQISRNFYDIWRKLLASSIWFLQCHFYNATEGQGL